MRSIRRFVVVTSLLCASLSPRAGAAPPVSGSVTVNGQKADLVKAYVDESQDDVIVVLASKEIPRAAGAASPAALTGSAIGRFITRTRSLPCPR